MAEDATVLTSHRASVANLVRQAVAAIADKGRRSVRVVLPPEGMSQSEILDTLESMRRDDVRWKDGRVFSLAYYASPEAHELATEAYRRFSGENALNVDAFPSLRTMQADVLSIVAGWLGAPRSARGFFSSGGTESILMAVKAARERGRAERKVDEPEIVLPVSAHAAFHKAAHYFGLTVRPVPVRDDWRADVDAAAELVNDKTVLVVGSAPQYPQGVVDPIPELAALASSVGANNVYVRLPKVSRTVALAAPIAASTRRFSCTMIVR